MRKIRTVEYCNVYYKHTTREYVVKPFNSTEKYFTEDLDDAITTAKLWSKEIGKLPTVTKWQELEVNLNEVVVHAQDMVGAYHPDEMEEMRERYQKFHVEVLHLFKLIQKKQKKGELK